MVRAETFRDRLKEFLHFNRVARKPLPVAPALPEKDPFLEQQAAALVKITKDPKLTEVVVDSESGLHRIVDAHEITVKI